MFTVIMLFGILTSSISAVRPQWAMGAAPNAIPAPTVGTVRPTISLSVTRGFAGQLVTASGAGVASSPGVRVAWLYGDATVTTAVVGRGVDNTYSVQTQVPENAEPGPAKLCATITGSAQAEFACADFVVEAPPGGSVQGQLPSGVLARAASRQPGATSFRLLDAAGTTVAEARIASNGSFQLNNVAPGEYKAAVVGTVNQAVIARNVVVRPGLPVAAEFDSNVSQCARTAALAATMGARPSYKPVKSSIGKPPFDPGYDY